MQVSPLSRARLLKLSQAATRSASQPLNRIRPPLRTAVVDPAPSAPNRVSATTWDVRVLYDGECPLCLKEINMLKRRDSGRNKISFVNIATPDYEPLDNGGVTYGKAMGRIHGLLPDGNVIEGVEVLRRCYEAVGLGWIYAVTSVKPVEDFVTFFYNIWARYRLQLTGRSSEGIEQMTRWNDGLVTCDNADFCDLPWIEEEAQAVKK